MVAVGIIGGGFWGSAVAHRLTEVGVEHIVIDDAHPLGASRVAAGICKLSWYKQDTVTKMMNGVFTYTDFRDGFDWLGERVKVEHTPEQFVNVPRGTTSRHEDNYLADPADLFVSTARHHVRKLVPQDHNVYVVTDDYEQAFDRVVICAGAATDDLLHASGLGKPTGVTGLLGRAITFDCDEYEYTSECMTVMTRPYVHYTYRHFRGLIRGGDTVERKRDDKRLVSLIETAMRHFVNITDVHTIAGVRPVCKRMFVDRVHPRIVVATGGHRVGFGLAGAVSARVMELL